MGLKLVISILSDSNIPQLEPRWMPISPSGGSGAVRGDDLINAVRVYPKQHYFPNSDLEKEYHAEKLAMSASNKTITGIQ
jgi:hypothetical protein